MCMHTTNQTDRHIFFLCFVCDQQVVEKVHQTERAPASCRPLDTECQSETNPEREKRVGT